MRLLSFAKMSAAMAVFATLLAACVVVEDGPGGGPGPGPRPPIPQEPQFCTREYAPVCAQRGGDRRTFSNDCEADRSGYRVIRDGECRGGPGGPGGPGLPGGPGGPGRPQACTQQYAPVCAERGGSRQTFGNECVARSEGFRVISDGECRRETTPGPGPGRPGPQACTREYAPVCGQRGRDVRTFGNSCEAESQSYRIVGRGPC